MTKILIIDDEIQFVEMIRLRLEANGYEVITANDGEKGLEKAKNGKPDLIILDVMMPKIGGYEVCRLLKNDARYNKIPIMICTGKAQPEDVEEASRKVGADAYVMKPFESPVFLAKIEELLKKA